MFKEKYNQLFRQINVDEDMVNLTINTAKNCNKKRKNIFCVIHKPIIALASICLCVILAMPVLAANVEPIYQLMYTVSPPIAQFFKPIKKSAEDNGIKMEVVSVNINQNVAKIYITMQDLTENRIDETTDLFDSYSINRPFDSVASCKRVGYDKSTKTVTFLITIEEVKNQKINGKITFSIKEFLSQKTSKMDTKIDINLSDYNIQAEHQTQSPVGGGSANKNFELPQKDEFLVPKPSIYSITDNIDISNIGYIDEKLHIQMRVKEKMTLNPHGYFYLIDSNGNKVKDDYSISYRDNSNNTSIDYDEFIFDVKKEELQNYNLYGSFFTAGINTKGNWQVTFSLED